MLSTSTRHFTFLIFSLSLCVTVFAQVPDSSLRRRTFLLGEVSVIGRRASDTLLVASSAHMEAFNRLDVGRALALLPGVNLSNVGARNESMVYIRGFDLRQVPVFVDGIPVYVPYDGYVDLARFTTFDLAEINISKGFTSVTYGPNTMGGAINLVSRRPQKSLEFDGKVGMFSGNGRRLNLNLGSKLGRFYIQGSASQLKQDTYPLSSYFVAKAQEDGGDRQNAFRDDIKYSVKVGFTPNATDEYALSYINQQGTKGTPPYVGDDTRQNPRFWQWPYWDKESWYFISKTRITAKSYLKARVYYDRFKNLLSAFDDNTYTKQTRGSSFNSYYNDDTKGASLELGIQEWNKHTLKASVHYKHDHHRENNLGEPVRNFIDQTYSLGIEDVIRLGNSLTLVPGLSFNARQSDKAENYASSTKTITLFPKNNSQAFNAQAVLFYSASAARQLSFTVARQSRFATIKDRYSYRMGAAIPNPDLKAEGALHFDAGYNEQFASFLKLQANVFYSRISDAIQQVNNVQPNIYQFQNTGKAEFYGSEISLHASAHNWLQGGIQYSYISRKNLSNPDLKFIDVPPHKLLIFAQAHLLKRISWLASVEYNAKRFSTSYGTEAASFVVANTKLSAKVWRFIQLEGGINNIFDRNYALSEGFPEAGRNYFINLVFNNL